MAYRRTPSLLILITLILAASTVARAQDIEPRAYSNAPVGVNFLIGGYVYTQGSLPTDPDLPLTNSKLTTSSAVLAYGHVFELWGQSAKVNLVAPYSWLGGNAIFAGQPIQRSVDGLADTIAQVSVNFLGAPAKNLQEFRNYQRDLILGARIIVTAPAGQYDSSRLVKLGTNRWSFRPELGVSKAFVSPSNSPPDQPSSPTFSTATPARKRRSAPSKLTPSTISGPASGAGGVGL